MHPIGASFWNAGPKIRGAFLGGKVFDGWFFLAKRDVM